MASEEKQKYVCIREEQIGKHESDITELKVRADYKENKVEELSTRIRDIDLKLDEKMRDMNEKLDKITSSIENLKFQSAQDDYDIDNRVQALESKIETLKWITGIAVSVLSILVAILGIVISHIH